MPERFRIRWGEEKNEKGESEEFLPFFLSDVHLLFRILWKTQRR
jgi:hypothetical protein